MPPRSVRRMHVLAAALLLLAGPFAIGCGGGVFGRVYEYEEDIYVALDGSASVIVNASVPALVFLRGLDLDLNSPRIDRQKLRQLYESPVTEVTRVSRPWRRNGRTYVQIRVSATDIRELSKAAPFAWSTYELQQHGSDFIYKQTVGRSALRPGTLQNVGWTGGELVAFRLHLPSRILEHNSRDLEEDVPNEIARGNILGWEQRLADRLDGQPVKIEVRMDRQTILYRTLWLFAGAFGAAVLLLGGLIWFTLRKGTKETAAAKRP